MRASKDVRELMRDAISRAKDPSPERLAEAVMRKLDKADVDALVVASLMELAKQEFSVLRVPGHSELNVPAAGVSRWKRMSRLQLDGLGIAITVGGVARWVEDCTADDLLAYAGEQRARADDFVVKAEIANDLANRLRRSGAATLGEWDRAGRPDGLAVAA